MDTMQTLTYKAKGEVAEQKQKIPTPGPGEVRVRVAYAGICGTDLSIVAGKHPRAKTGLTMGHEFSGIVDAKGPHTAADFSIGDHVVVEPLISCGECYACRSGFAYVCDKLGLYGIDAPGAFAEYVIVSADKVFPLPTDLSLLQGVLIEPVAVAVHAVRLSAVKTGDSVVVLGGGPIGLLTALVLQKSGASRVMLFELQPKRVELARSFGLEVYNSGEVDLKQIVMENTRGRGANLVFEAAGAQATITAAPSLCCVRGEIVQIAMPKDPRNFDIVALTFREITMKGVRVYAPFDFERAIEFVREASFDLTKLLSPPFSLKQGNQAFEKAREGADTLRVIFGIHPK